jgi:hypothetical protein
MKPLLLSLSLPISLHYGICSADVVCCNNPVGAASVPVTPPILIDLSPGISHTSL